MEYGKNISSDKNPQRDEESVRITPSDPTVSPKDSTLDAKERWDSESPAGQGGWNISRPQKDDENDEFYDPDAHKNIK